MLSRLLWNNHQRYLALSKKCDAYLFIDFRTGVLSVYGDEAQQQSAKVVASSLVPRRWRFRQRWTPSPTGR